MARRRTAPSLGFKLHRLEDRLAPAIDSGVPVWQDQGGGTGQVSDVAVVPDNENVLFASGTNGGVWRTLTAQVGSPTWVPLTDRLASLSVADMSYEPSSPLATAALSLPGLPANNGQLVFGIGDVTGATIGDQVGLYYSNNPLANDPANANPLDRAPVFQRLAGPVSTAFPQGAFVNTRVQSVLARNFTPSGSVVGTTPVGYILATTANDNVYLAYRRANGSIDAFTQIGGSGGLSALIGGRADLVSDPGNPKRVYIVGNAGAFRTDDITLFKPPVLNAAGVVTTAGTFPTFADLTPALTAATGSATPIAGVGSNTIRVRAAVHSSAAGNVAYVAVVNPGPGPAGRDDRVTVFWSTDQPTAGAGLTGTWTAMDEPLQLSGEVQNASNASFTDASYATPIVVTTPTRQPENFATGDRVLIEGVTGNAAANGVWTITVTGNTAFSLNGSAGTGKFTTGTQTLKRVYGVATTFAADRFALAADPVNPNFVYVGGGGSFGNLFSDRGLPDLGGQGNIVRGDRTRPRLFGLISTPLVERDATLQWTSLAGYKAAGGNPIAPTPTSSGFNFTNLIAQPVYQRDAAGAFVTDAAGNRVVARTELLAAAGNPREGVFKRVNPGARGTGDFIVPYPSDNATNVWSDRSGNLSMAEIGSVVYDPTTQSIFGSQAVDAVTSPGVSYRFFNPSGGFTGRFDTYNASGFVSSSKDFTLYSATDQATLESGLSAADKFGFLLVQPNTTPARDRFTIGEFSRGKNWVLFGGTNLYEDNFPDDGVGNVIGDITPPGMTGQVSALVYGGREPGNLEDDGNGGVRIRYVQTPRVAYVGTSTGQVFVRAATDGFYAAATLPGTGAINDIVSDPDDWRIAYVLRGNSQIYKTLNGGLTFELNGVPGLTGAAAQDLTRYVDSQGNARSLLNSGSFDAAGNYTGAGTFDPQGNVSDGFTTQLFHLALFDAQTQGDTAGFPVTTAKLQGSRSVTTGAVPGVYQGVNTRQDVLLASGKTGVYRYVSFQNPDAADNPGNRLTPAWTEFGRGLPNVPVTDISIGTYFDGTVRRAGLAVSTSGRGDWVIPDVAPYAAARTQVRVTANVQNADPTLPSTVPSGQPLVATLSADPSNSAFVTVTDGLSDPQTFERTVIQDFSFAGTDQADKVTLAAAPGSDLLFVRFPLSIDLKNSVGDQVSVVNGIKATATVVTVDVAGGSNSLGDPVVTQVIGVGPTDNLFNGSAGGSLRISGLTLGTVDLNVWGVAPGTPASKLPAAPPANQVFVRGGTALTTRVRVGPRDTVTVNSDAGFIVPPGTAAPVAGGDAGTLDGLIGNLEVVANTDAAGASQAALVVSDRQSGRNLARLKAQGLVPSDAVALPAARGNPNAVIGSTATSDGTFGLIDRVGGPRDSTQVRFQNVATLSVFGVDDAAAAESYTVADPPATLTLLTGDGPDELNVQALTRPATLNTGPGNDTIRVSSRAGSSDDGDLSRITVPLTLEAGTGDNRLIVSNAGSPVTSTVTITRAAITGASAGAIGYAATGGRFVDPAGGAGILYQGSNQTSDQITLASALAGSQVTIDGRGGPDGITVVGDDLRQAAVVVRGGGGGDTVTVTQGIFGLNASSLLVAGTGPDILAVQGYDQRFRTDSAVLRLDSNGAGSVFVDGGLTDARFSGVGTVVFDGLAGRNNLNLVDNTNTVLGSPANPGSGIVVAPLGETSGTARFGGLAPAVRFSNVNGGDADGLVVTGDPTGTGKFADTLTVVGPSETGLGGAGTLAGLEATTADSTITVSDRQVVFERSSAGPLRSVALGRVNDRATISNLVVLAGNQSKQGDRVTVVPSREVNILVDGQGPARSGNGGNVLTVGTDQPFTLSSTTSAALGGGQTRVETGTGAAFGYRGFGRLVGGAGGGRSIYAVGADVGGGPRVRVYDALTQEVLFDQFVYEPTFTGGVRVATGDVTGDGVPDLITAAGPGGGPRVSVYDGVTFKVVSSFFAYEPTFAGGLYLAVGDLDGNGFGEIVTGTGVGGGPLVKAFDAGGKLLTSTFAFETTFRGGVRVAVGDVTGDGKADLITTAGPGGGPVVRVFDPTTLKPVVEYFAADPALRTGLSVAAGDLTGDGLAEIVVGPASGPVSLATVRRGADGSFLQVPLFEDQGADPTPAGVLTDLGGVRLAVADATTDGTGKVFLAARGPGFPSKVYRYFIDPILATDPTQAFEDAFVGGVWVG